MVFDEVLLLPNPCSTRKAPRRSDGRNPRGTCTTPESLRPADGKVTASSVIGVVSVRGGVATLSERRRDGRWIAGCRATHEGVMAAPRRCSSGWMQSLSTWNIIGDKDE